MSKERNKRLLKWFLESGYWQYWDAENRSCGGNMILKDHERFERIWNAAENGAEGSTHGEIIQDWRDCLECWKLDKGYYRLVDAITQAIDDVEKWHENNNSLDAV